MAIKDSMDDGLSYARDKTSTAKATANEAISSARDKASDLAASAREAASQARLKTADGVDANPVAALIGGLALGALAAAVLPRTRKEEELLGPVGAKINDRARTAAQSAMEAGQNKLDELGISKDSAIDKAREFAQSAADVVKETATAAASGASNASTS